METRSFLSYSTATVLQFKYYITAVEENHRNVAKPKGMSRQFKTPLTLYYILKDHEVSAMFM